MTQHVLHIGGIYLMSGPPSSGKTTLTESLNLPQGSIVSSDALRELLYGVRREVRDGTYREHLYGWDMQANKVFGILETIVEERAREGLTTFVDAVFATDQERASIAKIAEAAGVPFTVLIMNTPETKVLASNRVRPRYVDDSVIRRQFGMMQRENESKDPAQRGQYHSRYPHIVVNEFDSIKLEPAYLPGDMYDVVGDVHGLYDDLVELFVQAGYQFDERGIPFHPEGRKLVFLGDVVDRGQQSIEMLRFVELCVREGGHIFIPGNHEDKLAKTYYSHKKSGELLTRSQSSAETYNELMKLDKDEAERLMLFIRNQPAYRLISSRGESFVCAHADMSGFDPKTTPRSGVMYGTSDFGNRDSDAEYQAGYNARINKHTLLRGHIPQISPQDNVFSIEFEQAYGGHLAMLHLDKFTANIEQGMARQEAFTAALTKEACTFNYDVHSAKQFATLKGLNTLHKNKEVKMESDLKYGLKLFNANEERNTMNMIPALEELEKQKLVKSAPDPEGQLSIYKYSKQVFFDGLWDKHPLLLKARGLVLDIAGNIVQHPFDKIFNYGERGTALAIPDDTRVQVVEKLNGFLGCITKHPYLKDELLVTTTGSFTSPFVKYINDFITPELKARLLEKLSADDKTLMFEVIHPEDNEHPIEYKVEDQGLWLIGARGKDENAPLESETWLDNFGAQVGIKRPKHFEATLGDVRELAKTSNLEGYILRRLDGLQDAFVKFKTTYYLTTKFVSRLSKNNVAFMFANPEKFKEKVDEEYVEMVDAVIARTQTAQAYQDMPKGERVEMVRAIVNQLREDAEKAANAAVTEPVMESFSM